MGQISSPIHLPQFAGGAPYRLKERGGVDQHGKPWLYPPGAIATHDFTGHEVAPGHDPLSLKVKSILDPEKEGLLLMALYTPSKVFSLEQLNPEYNKVFTAAELQRLTQRLEEQGMIEKMPVIGPNYYKVTFKGEQEIALLRDYQPRAWLDFSWRQFFRDILARFAQ